MTGLEQIERTVLELPAQQRAWLAESLLASLPSPSDADGEDADLEEAERREREIEAGLARPLSEAELWRRVESSRPK